MTSCLVGGEGSGALPAWHLEVSYLNGEGDFLTTSGSQGDECLPLGVSVSRKDDCNGCYSGESQTAQCVSQRKGFLIR